MKRKGVLSLLLISSLVLTACAAGPTQDTQTPVQKEVLVPVEVEALEASQITDEFFLLGQVEAARTYSLAAPAGQEVDTVFVNVGDTVKEGDILFELVKTSFENTASAQRIASKAQLDSAWINYDNAKKSLADNDLLLKNGAISQSQYDQVKTQFDTARVNYNNAAEQYRSTLETLDKQSGDLVVTSPIDGTVIQRTIEEDETSTGQSMITISELDPVKVKANVPASQIRNIEVDMPVRIFVPGIDEERLGSITTVSLAAVGGAYPVEIELDNTNGSLLPGMVTEVYVQLQQLSDALVVPLNALVDDGNHQNVFIEEDGVAVQVDVELGIREGSRVQVLGDLEPGANLIVKGQHFVEDGTKVDVIEEND